MTITELLGKQRKPVLVMLGALLLVLVSAGDYLTHTIYWLEFSPFYLVPVSFFSWFVGKRTGFVAAGTSVIIGFFITLQQIPGSIAYWDLVIRFALYVSSTLMISQLKMLYDRERQLSRLDPLTKIENRRAFFEATSRAQSFSERNGVPLSIAYLDVDGFKQLNDRFGHRTGDKILTAAEMQSERRSGPLIWWPGLAAMNSQFYYPPQTRDLLHWFSVVFASRLTVPCRKADGQQQSALEQKVFPRHSARYRRCYRLQMPRCMPSN